MKKTLSLIIAAIICTIASARNEEWLTQGLQNAIDAFYSNDSQKAMSLIEEELNSNPENGYGWFYYGLFAYDLNLDPETIIKIEKKATKLISPKDGEALSDCYYVMGMAYSINEDHSKAIKMYELAIKHNKKNIYVYKNICGEYLTIHEYEKAEKYADKIIETNNSDGLGYYSKATVYACQEKWDEAEKYCNEALKTDEFNSKYHILKAGLLEEKDSIKSAIIEYISAIITDPSEESAISSIKSYLQDEEYEAYTLSLLRQVCTEFPNQIMIKFLTADYYLTNNQFEIAEEYYEELNDSVPNQSIFVGDLTTCYYESGRLEDIIKITDKLLKTDSTDIFAWSIRADAFNLMQDNNSAIKCIDNAINLAPTESVLYYNKGRILEHTDNPNIEEAAKCYMMSVIADTTNINAWTKLGTAYDRLNMTTDADSAYIYAIDLAQEYKKGSINGLCYAYYFLEDYDGAEKEMEAAIKNNPRINTLLDAICIYSLLNKTEEAEKYLDIYLKRGGKDFFVLEKSDYLNNLREKINISDKINEYMK